MDIGGNESMLANAAMMAANTRAFVFFMTGTRLSITNPIVSNTP